MIDKEINDYKERRYKHFEKVNDYIKRHDIPINLYNYTNITDNVSRIVCKQEFEAIRYKEIARYNCKEIEYPNTIEYHLYSQTLRFYKIYTHQEIKHRRAQ